MFKKSSKSKGSSSSFFKRADSSSPFFPQAKMETNVPGDALEKEADDMADMVVQKAADTEDKLQLFANEEDSTVQRSVEEENEGIQLAETDEKLQLQEDEEVQLQDEEVIQMEEEYMAKPVQGSPVPSSVESSISSSKGSGSALPEPTRNSMESGFGADFSQVKVHTDSSAVQMSKELGAQAFTHGNDIYFNEGKYNPDSKDGQHLLAHELTHTLQQGGSTHKVIQQQGDESSSTSDPADILKTFHLPAVKARHLQLYQAWASQNKLKRLSSFSRDTSPEDRPRQDSNWKNEYWDKMQNTDNLGLHEEFTGVKTIKIPGDREMRGRRRTLLKNLTKPDWDKNGAVQKGKNRFEVDHIVELQVAGWASNQEGNDFPNMELLDGISNASAGGKTRSNIERTVRDYLEASALPSSQADARTYMSQHDLIFERVQVDQSDSSNSKYWTREEITQGIHLGELEDLGNIGEPGSPTEFALMTPDDGYLMELFPHEEQQLNIDIPEDNVKAKAVAGLAISNISLSSGYAEQNPDANIGNITATWDLPENFNAPEGSFSVPLNKSQSQYAGKVGNLPELGSDFEFLSPISFSGMEINENGINAEGRLTPSLPFLQNTVIRVGIRGQELYFRGEFSPSQLNIPIPRLKVNSSTLYVEYNTTSGFGVGGDAELELPQIAIGEISAGFTQGEGLFLRGNVVFDENLFGGNQASVRLAYENENWSAGGTLSIPPNKVAGINQATINVEYSQDSGFTASGDATLSIPGIDTGRFEIAYNDEGFIIEGSFGLSADTPGIRGGNVDARVSKMNDEEGYSVYVSGTAQPDIPGINSTLTVVYENGAITISGAATYQRGMLSGTLEVGATNKSLDDDGEPTGEPSGNMSVYGGGSLTLQLTPWLAATAGVNFLPNGEMEVTARLSTDTYDVFPRREYNRNLFTAPTIEIPLFAIPLGPRSIGLVAQIGGGLDFKAGFGPGQLRGLSAEIFYNPDREEETTLSGQGEFAIPADAGLTLRGDLGLGVSVGVASLTGGIELAGTLGLEGEAAAGVQVDWAPDSGISLNANGRIMVNPVFTFDVNAFARGSLGIGFLSISKTWRHNLASFDWGPNLQFGIIFPIRYQEGEPFDMSLDDIEVVYPDIDVVNTAVGLARDIKNDLFD